jgi:hypothetical protein
LNCKGFRDFSAIVAAKAAAYFPVGFHAALFLE